MACLSCFESFMGINEEEEDVEEEEDEDFGEKENKTSTKLTIVSEQPLTSTTISCTG